MSKDKQNKTEDLLKQKLEKFELPVEDFVFDAIQTKITAPKRKQGVWFWAVLIGSVVPLLVALLFFFNPFGKSSIQDPGTIPGDTEINEPQSDAPYGIPKDEEPTENLESEKIPVDVKSNRPGENLPKSGQQSRVVVTSSSLASPANVFVKEPAQATTQNVLDEGASQLSSVEHTPDLTANSARQPETAVTQGAPDALVTDTVSSHESFENTAATNALRNNSTNSLPSDEPEKPGLVEAIVLNNSVDSADAVSEDKLLTDLISEEEVPGTLSKFSLQALGGVGFSYRILRSPANEELQTHKNDHERYGLTFSFGLGARYHISDALYVGVGLGYASYSERYDFHHDTISHSTVNTYNYIQVPLTLGIRLFNSKRLALYGQMGMVWNSLTEAQSSWVDPNSLSAVSHSNTGSKHPFQENTFQSTLGLDIAIKLNEHWQVNLIPSASIFLNSVYLQSTNLDQKPYSGSLNIGITRRF